jgi:hypothetical protein
MMSAVAASAGKKDSIARKQRSSGGKLFALLPEISFEKL